MARRLIETKEPSDAVTFFQYGVNGQLEEMQSPRGVERTQFDAEGRLLLNVDPRQRATRCTYDAGDWAAARIGPLGHRQGYGAKT
ncbi:hypothetical protein [Burkholderia gladioli]|uniref:hypothetical protein n=1 Tax=Burkholderia gladioli TaxID=28095 RepID=UPI0016414916|nr:hypothetical protein [Burkholderia gladioli]